MTILQGPSHLPENTKITSLVILLHGYGADGHDLISLAPLLSTHLPNTAFHSPDGPETCELSPFGKQWFSLQRCDADFLRRNPATQDIAFEAMYRSACEAAPKVEEYIHALMAQYEVNPNQVTLVGFSQGTMMALHVGLRHAEQFGAIIGFSGALVGAKHLEAEIKSHPPVLLIHGEADEMLPIHALDLAQSALEHVGIQSETLRRPGLPHAIDDEGIVAALAFMHKNIFSKVIDIKI